MITLISQKFYYPDYSYSGTGYTDFLFGCIGDKVRAETQFSVHWETEAINMTFNFTNKTVERNDGGIGSFVGDGFKVGDTITIQGTALNNISTTITGIDEDGTIMTLAGVSSDESSVTCSIFGVPTSLTAFDYYPNICENDSTTFFDLTDRNTIPRYFIDSYSAMPAAQTAMTVGSNSIGWVTGVDGNTNGCTIEAIATIGYRRIYNIKHTFLITPVYLAGELTNLQNRLPPSNFRERKALKYICQIDAKYSNFNPVIPHTAQFISNRGNTGWFNEYINGNPTDYTFSSIAITNAGVAVDEIQYCGVNTVEIKIKSSASRFSDNGRKIILNMMWLPQYESSYIDKSTDWKKNFIFERAVTIIHGITVQGENQNADYHFLKNVTSARVSSSEAKINFTVEYSSALKALFDLKDTSDLNYLIWITTEQGGMATPLGTPGSATLGDRTAVICNVDVYDCDKDDATLFSIIDHWNFYEYPSCTGIGYSEIKGYARDTWQSIGQFYLLNGSIAQDISIRVEAINSVTGDKFDLQNYSIDLTPYQPDCNGVQVIDFIDINEYKLAADSCLDRVRLRRMPTLDLPATETSAAKAGYVLVYPLKIRWEGWQNVFPANDCFPNATQDWITYQQIPNWSLQFVVEANILKDEHITNFRHISDITIKDPCDDTIATEIKTYEETGVTEIDDLIIANENTLVEVVFRGDFTDYAIGDLYAIGYIDVYGVGGENYILQISTEEDNNVDIDFLQGVSSGTRATLTKISNSKYKLTWILAYEFMPTNVEQFIISARIGFKQSSQSSSGTCPVEINFLPFTCGELDIIAVESTEILVVSGMIRIAEEGEVSLLEMRLERITQTSWRILSGGTVDGDSILSGTITSNTSFSPAHPYTDDLVDDIINGQLLGTVNTSDIN